VAPLGCLRFVRASASRPPSHLLEFALASPTICLSVAFASYAVWYLELTKASVPEPKGGGQDKGVVPSCIYILDITNKKR